MLSGISGLIASIAGLITALTGFLGMVIVARRTSPRERTDAAQKAAEQVLNPAPPKIVEEAVVIEQLHEARKRKWRGIGRGR